MALTPKVVPELQVQGKALLENWMRLRLAFQRAFSKGPIARDHENAFLQLKSELARLNRIFQEQLPQTISYGSEDVADMMKNTTTLQQLHSLPPHERVNIFTQWHKIYVKINRMLGALDMINEGYYPALHRNLLMIEKRLPASAKTKKAKKKK